MKPRALVIGDLWVPFETFRKEFHPLVGKGFELLGKDWLLKDMQELTQVNLSVEKQGPDAVVIPEEIMKEMENADVLAVQFCPISRKTMERCKKLKLIGVMRAGTENIDLEAAKELGIGVLNVRGRNAQAVAEFTLGLLLAETRNIARSHHALMQGTWRKEYHNSNAIPEVHGKVLGIIGLGEIGIRLARLLSGFEMKKILVHDPFVSAEVMAEVGAESVSLEVLCRESDYISINARLTEETRHLLSDAEFRMMKPSAYVINTARAGLIDENALIAALQDGQIAGACVDVFEHEPLPADSPFLTLDNVTLTTHLAGTTADSFTRSAQILVEDMVSLVDGKKAKYSPVRETVDGVDWRKKLGFI